MHQNPLATKQKGDQAEEKALHYLQQQGLEWIASNFTSRFGEIDLIMRDVKRDNTVFVEVRYRKNSRIYGGSLESIDFRKQQRIIKTATYYLHTHKWAQQFSCRFDAVLITGNTTNPQLSWISDAFRI